MMTKVCPFLFRFVFGIVFMDCIVCIIQSLDNFVENRNLHYVFLRLRSSSEYISVSMPRGLISDRRHHIWKCDGCILFAMMCLSGAVLWNNVLFSMTVQTQFSCWRAQWAEHRDTFLLEFGPWEHVNLSVLNFTRMVKAISYYAIDHSRIEVFPNFKIQKKGLAAPCSVLCALQV